MAYTRAELHLFFGSEDLRSSLLDTALQLEARLSDARPGAGFKDLVGRLKSAAVAQSKAALERAGLPVYNERGGFHEHSELILRNYATDAYIRLLRAELGPR